MTEVLSLIPDGQNLLWAGIAALYTGMSIIAFVMYGLDKMAARNSATRISERTLLLCGLVGGWPGAMLAQRLFRHKTIKPTFRMAFVASIFLNCLLLCLLFLLP